MSRCIIGASWELDAAHLSEEGKRDLLASYQPYQRDARTKGIPSLGAGAVYPFPESEIKIKDFPIPKHWKRAFGMDCALAGTTAAAWGAIDPETQTAYIYSVYRRGQAEVAVHAQAFKDRGAWIPGVGDAADIIDEDRTSFLDRYRKCGIDLVLADKAVETGIQTVYDMLSSGALRVFESCQAYWEEFRMYRRDEKGRIVKQRDHVQDSTRYLCMNGFKRAKAQAGHDKPKLGTQLVYSDGRERGGWMG